MRPSASLLSLLRKLIAFPTVSRESNLGLIEWVRDELAALGVESRLTYDEQGCKANLFATLGESRAPGGLVLSGHTDVVPVDGQNWHSDPFAAAIVDDKLYGRGSADMKGFIAAALTCVPRALDRGGPPIHLALSYDEEVGCLGAPRMLADLRAAGIHPEGCIIGEPTHMGLVNGHKGASVHRCKVQGLAAHSSLAPKGVNAIVYGAQIITRLQQIAERLLECEKSHPGYDIPHTTVNVGVISGGVASNIVAQHCEFRFDIRHLPWTKPETIIAELEDYVTRELLPEMRENAADASITFEQLSTVPALATDVEAPLARRVARLLGSPMQATQVGFGTEGGLFRAAGIATLICGPGSISQAHQANEFITLEQLARCERFLQALIEETTTCH